MFTIFIIDLRKDSYFERREQMPVIFDNNDFTTKEVFSVEKSGNKVVVCFKENGKKYSYSKDRIRVVGDVESVGEEVVSLSIPLYSLKHKCWKCGHGMTIPTYVNYEKRLEPLQYPWDKNRLNREKSDYEHELHIFTDTGIEYYPVSVLGQNPMLDQLLIEQCPTLVREANMRKCDTSRMPGYVYLAAHCPQCRVVQGWFPSVYRQINIVISKEMELPVIGYLKVSESSLRHQTSAGNTVETLWRYIPDV
jgi:hypothetical protein